MLSSSGHLAQGKQHGGLRAKQTLWRNRLHSFSLSLLGFTCIHVSYYGEAAGEIVLLCPWVGFVELQWGSRRQWSKNCFIFLNDFYRCFLVCLCAHLLTCLLACFGLNTIREVVTNSRISFKIFKITCFLPLLMPPIRHRETFFFYWNREEKGRLCVAKLCRLLSGRIRWYIYIYILPTNCSFAAVIHYVF